MGGEAGVADGKLGEAPSIEPDKEAAEGELRRLDRRGGDEAGRGEAQAGGGARLRAKGDGEEEGGVGDLVEKERVRRIVAARSGGR